VTDNGVDDQQNHNNYLWNAMVHPLLKMILRGAIWYQGEQNAGYPWIMLGTTGTSVPSPSPTMIESWRQAWAEATGGDTDHKFHFWFCSAGSLPLSQG
jgi:sialate O-acetylesterase